jgi:type 1 glutamine amidotransferase
MKAVVISGGWEGHDPVGVGDMYEKSMPEHGFEVTRSNSLDILTDEDLMKDADVIIPIWTMGEMTDAQWESLDRTVQGGCGIAGVHGGMGDAFRGNLAFQMMVGGQFVDHPRGMITYRVAVVDRTHPVTAGMENFDYTSEQYYMLVNPANRVLAHTIVDVDGCVMPVAWTKSWGKGRVFYSALGHEAKEFVKYPEVWGMTVRGAVWAAEGRNA